MASLTGQTIQSTYDSLLKISGNDSLTSSLQRITDGLGNFTPLYLSTTAVEISSGLNVLGSITGSNLSGTNTGDETNASIKTKLGAASGSQDGYLTSTDWSTFNAKQPALGYTPVPQTRTLTINGTTFDLSADRSWTISTGVTRSQIITALGTGGSPFEFLKSDGTVDSNSYVTFGRTLTINGVTYDLSADRSWTIAAGVTSFNTRTGAITLTSGDVTGALGYTPVGLSSFSASFPLAYNSTTGAFSIAQASSSQGGFLSSTDWSTFNNKLSTAIIALNGLTSVSQSFQTGTSGTDFAISSSGSVHTFNIPTASGSARGLLSSSDWTSFNSKVSSQWITSGSNIYYNTGNVGIGTTTPNSATNYSTLSVNGSSGGQITWQTGGSLIGYAYNTVNGLVVGANTDKILVFDAGASERMRITSTGNVGIGTSSPATNLHIASTVNSPQVRISSTGSGVRAQLNTVNDHGDWLWGVAGDTTGDGLIYTSQSRNLRLFTADAERMRITSAGNVGIGTSTPGAPLAFADVNSLKIQFNADAANYYGIAKLAGGGTLQDGNLQFVAGNTFAGGFTFSTGGTERVRISHYGALSVNTLGGPVINNTTLSLRSINTTATDRVIEGYSIGFSALFYVQNNGSYFFAGSNLSDARTKKDINYLNDSVLDKVMQLKPASFKYIQNDENVKGGFIAQDVKEIFPDLVTKTQSEEDMMGVDYYGVIGILTKAIQEQQAQINELKARLENGI